MTATLFAPPLDPAPATVDRLTARGYALIDAQGLGSLTGADVAGLEALAPTWDDLPSDPYLKDGGRYRRRRHACFVVDGATSTLAPHRAHWQPVEYNALHGGMQRWFEPIGSVVLESDAWRDLLVGLGRACSRAHGERPWFVEAHQFRIDTEGGIGRPTPEGAHRDGVDFVAVILIGRRGVKGGETRVFDADGPNGQRFTMTAPWTTLLLDDARVIHETTPIQPLDEGRGVRDTLVLTYRAGAFQGDDAPVSPARESRA